MSPQTTPTRLHLKKDQRLEVDWADGQKCVYSIAYLRSMCPCAQCRTVREAAPASAGAGASPAAPHSASDRPKKTSLTILPGNYAKPLQALSAELVGNYAIRIDWSDAHGSGIYSFQYLREICPPTVDVAKNTPRSG